MLSSIVDNVSRYISRKFENIKVLAVVEGRMYGNMCDLGGEPGRGK